QIRSWRRQLHEYDVEVAGAASGEDGSHDQAVTDSEGDGETGDIGRAPWRSSSDGRNVLDVPVRGSSQHDDLEATAAPSASLSPAAAAAAAADPGALVIGVSDDSGYAGADGSKESSLAAEENSFSAKEGSFSAAREQGFSAGAEEKSHTITINAGIYGDSDGEDDGFGSSPGLNTAGPVDGAAGRRVAAAGAAAFSKGRGGKRRRGDARGESSTDDVTGSASASSPWCTNTCTSGDLWSDGDSASEDEDECQEGTERRRRKRRRGWADGRFVNLGGGEKLGRGELLAAEEEEEEEEEELREELDGARGMGGTDERGRELGDEIEGMGGGTAGVHGVGGEGGDESGLGGPGIEKAVEGGVRRMGGGVVEEVVMKEVDGMGVEGAVKSEVGGLERAEDEFSDDDLL
ncbi:unnamed protein product, partial [Ectocarpus sp. 8 AP-2014]